MTGDQDLVTLAVVLCGLFILMVVVIAVLAARQRRRRAARLLGWARANGWTLTERPGVDWGRRLPGGNRRGVSVALAGQARGRPVTVAEYSVTDGGAGENSAPNTHFYVVAVLRIRRPLPDLAVEPRSGLGRLVHGRGTPSGDPRFDRAFRVRTSDPAATPLWCTPALIRAHLDGAVPPWTLTGSELMTVEPGRLDPDTVLTHADRAAYLAALLDVRESRDHT